MGEYHKNVMLLYFFEKILKLVKIIIIFAN